MARRQPIGRSRVFAAVPSTVIRYFDYSAESRELTVEFVNGRRYVYSDVPEAEAQALRSAFARGVYFNTWIRDRFPCRELARADR